MSLNGKNKTAVYVLLLIVILASVFLILRITRQEFPLESALPEKAMFYGKVSRLGENLDRAAETKLWKDIAGIDYKTVLQKIGARPEGIARFEEVKKQLSSPVNQQLFKKFFGEEVALAVYSVSFKELTMESLAEIEDNVIFVTRIRSGLKLIDFFAKAYGEFNKEQDVIMTSMDYGKHQIHQVATKDKKVNVYYASYRDLLMVAASDKAVKKSLDTIEKKTASLKDDGAYKAVEKDFQPGADIVSYLDYEVFIGRVKEFAEKYAAGQKDPDIFKENIERAFTKLAGMKTIGYSFDYGDILKAKFDLHYDKSGLDPALVPIYACAPEDNRTLAFIPDDIIGYSWNSCIDFKYYFEQYEQQKKTVEANNPAAQTDPADGEGQFLGLSIKDDVLPVLGNEIGGYLGDIDVKGIFPMPRLLFFLELKARDQGEALIQKLLSQQGIFRPETEDYKGHKIQYITIPLMPNLQPAYVVFDDYLLVASNRRLLNASIDAAAGEVPGLKTRTGFKELDFGLTGKNNSVIYLQVEDFIRKVEALLDWGVQWLDLQMSKGDAIKSGSQKRLDEIRIEIGNMERDIEALNTKTGAIKAALTKDLLSTNAAELIEVRKQIEEKQKNIQVAREKEKELESMLELMDQQGMEPETKKVLVDELIRPLLKAFWHFKGFASHMVISQNLIETFMYLKME